MGTTINKIACASNGLHEAQQRFSHMQIKLTAIYQWREATYHHVRWTGGQPSTEERRVRTQQFDACPRPDIIIYLAT
ncbi:hypothetical protein E2C01_019683 [Portunus trituberculatus]|uniref:Uncharacterized protein n=1 Tax=Portunus trituberculatus TaxID=210409 RepID=A0A5B7DYA4_PORTR|nr:hypothetical protein [Portunus trituberculatus]